MDSKQIKETLKLTFPRIVPYKAVGDFKKSQLERCHIFDMRYDWDRPRKDPQCDLTEITREYWSTEDYLVTKREYYKQERVRLNEHWQQLAEDERSLRENFETMSEFMKSNESKRLRAVVQIQEEEKLGLQREKKIRDLREKTDALTLAKQELEQEMSDHKIYQKYLNDVVSEFEDLKNPDELIDRYETLAATRDELGAKQKRAMEALESAQERMAKITETCLNRILGLNTQLAGLNSRYQNVVADAMRWEKTVWAVKKYAFDKWKDIIEVQEACRNMYLTMCEKKNETPTIPEDNFEEHLIFIKKMLQVMSVIKTQGIPKKKHISSMKGEVSKRS